MGRSECTSGLTWWLSKVHLNFKTVMVISAVELMLGTYDRIISDRYKLIDYREADNQKSIVQLDDFLITVTVPVICTLVLLIMVCCCCSRTGSAVCSLFESKV